MMMSSLQLPTELRKRIQGLYSADEKSYVRYLAERAEVSQDSRMRIYNLAKQIIEKVRGGSRVSLIDSFMQEYGLSTEEGVALMCLAESLLRIPDECTIDDVIRDKITCATWNKHIGGSSSIFVNASTLALCMGARVLKEVDDSRWYGVLGNMLKNMGEPIIRKAALQAMTILGKHFVMGKNIEEAVARSNASGMLCSFDLLGEAARTKEDAERYFSSYMEAIEIIGKDPTGNMNDVSSRHGISVKLSSLHPRYEFGQLDYVIDDMSSKLLKLSQLAKEYNIGLLVDAEEARRLEFSLMILERVFLDKSLDGWEGLGIAVQAYQKRALGVLDMLEDISHRGKRRMMVRLVKGAYWDHEIKNAQELGLDGYPVFTRRAYTDISYLACVQRVLGKPNVFYPCLATHNAYALSSVLEVADKDHPGFEFQRLHAMAQNLYGYVTKEIAPNIKCRVYAPVGGYQELLPYLVRRLLENGTNSSFVNMINDSDVPVEQLLLDPLEKARCLEYQPHSCIPLPVDIFMAEGRLNSSGVNVSDSLSMSLLEEEIKAFSDVTWKVQPIVGGIEVQEGEKIEVTAVADKGRSLGEVWFATKDQASKSIEIAYNAYASWSRKTIEERAAILENAANLMQKERGRFFYLLMQEGGKVISDVVAEIREAVDFLRYYAALAKKDLIDPIRLPGPSGEENYMYFESRGVFTCISPWNFPLAIFMGPIAAALVTGNTVVAKPAEQTSIVAYEAIKLLYEAGVPHDVLHFVPGRGEELGDTLVSHEFVAGVVFTGSTETANIINKNIASRKDIIPFIAETGGINAMIVDSSALLEQVTDDVIKSAFLSAGQRCSSLRVLYIQNDIADKQIEMLCGAVKELKIGNPMLLSTDIGPVIDQQSANMLRSYVAEMSEKAKLIYKLDISHIDNHEGGNFFPPHILEVDSIKQVPREVFGPILHIVRYKKAELQNVIDDINSMGYGLTFAIHSRIQNNIDDIISKISVGNIYVNRNQVGAVVGAQPFGGRGLSGTGPKAGGPYYLHKFVTEKTVSVNSAALGGDVSLVCLEDD